MRLFYLQVGIEIAFDFFCRGFDELFRLLDNLVNARI